MEECQKFTSKYWEKVKYSKPQLSKFKKFVSRSVFGELQLTQISLNFQTSCYNLKIRGLGANLWVDFLVFFFSGRNYDVEESMLFVKQKYKL